MSTVELGTGLRSDSTAKQLLNSMKVTIDEVQLDRIDSGPQMQDALKEITGQRMVSALLSLEPAAAAFPHTGLLFFSTQPYLATCETHNWPPCTCACLTSPQLRTTHAHRVSTT